MRPSLPTVLLAATLLGAVPHPAAAGSLPALADVLRGQLWPNFGQRRDPPKEQAPQRHYADVPFDGDMEMSLKAWLMQVNGLHDLLDKLKQHPELFDPNKIAKGDWKDPKFLAKEGPKLLEMFKKLGWVEQGDGGVKLKLDQFKGLNKEQLKKQIEDWKARQEQNPDQGGNVPDPDAPPRLDDRTLPPRPQRPAPEPPAPGELEGQDKLAEFFKDWMLKMEDSKFGDLFRNSPAFQEGLRDLTESIRKGEAGLWKPGAGFAENLSRLANPGDLKWLTQNWSHFGNLSLPSLRPPHFGGPRFRWGANLPAPAMGWGAGPAVGGGGFGIALLWVGVAVVVVILLWKVLPQLKLAARDRARAGWQLGPWPVDPHRVATRAEVVKAFEFLSLLRFGLDVRTWNHRDIAAALGKQGGDRAAANELAQVYELARYTPDDERLPEASVAAARRDLCFLAGMS